MAAQPQQQPQQQQQQQQQHPLALPPTLSPDDLDAVSELSTVLAKVRAGMQSPAAISPGGGGGGGGAPALPLSFKDVPGATDGLKHKLQHARAQVRALPDMARSLDEQRREMGELEARIDRQRALLRRLREGGVAFGTEESTAEDVKMDM